MFCFFYVENVSPASCFVITRESNCYSLLAKCHEFAELALLCLPLTCMGPAMANFINSWHHTPLFVHISIPGKSKCVRCLFFAPWARKQHEIQGHGQPITYDTILGAKKVNSFT